MGSENLRGAGVRHNVDHAMVIHRALKEAGIDFVSLVFDSLQNASCPVKDFVKILLEFF